MQWTEEQKSVIDGRDKDMLVSAAAGSGKTAVLVERILGRITDEKHPVDIDRMLIVTFTNAAAAEMRERIRGALEKRLENDMDNAHLQRQITLVHHAQITTIHSFCLNVLRSHFQEIGLDPAFRIGDENEMQLLMGDVCDELLEEEYDRRDPEFVHFAETFATDKQDNSLSELILRLYDFSMAQPWPSRWRHDCISAYRMEDTEAMQDLPWVQDLITSAKATVKDLTAVVDAALDICARPDGPATQAAALEGDLLILEGLSGCESFDDFVQGLGNMSFQARSRAKTKTEDPALRKKVGDVHDQVKKVLTGLQEDIFSRKLEETLDAMRRCAPALEELVALTDRFQERFEEEKAARGMVDFSDLEHLTLKVLVEEKDGENVPTETARWYSDSFEEIMTDEYQDSNLVQETILGAVAGKCGKVHNRFMVGDVKQSIYRFRLASPEIFMGKYHDYPVIGGEQEADTVRIDLHRNFRSRSEILAGVNRVFERLMRARIGGIDYDEDAALSFGDPGYPEYVTEEPRNRIILVEKPGKEDAADDEGDEETEEITAQEAEAAAVAQQILKAMDTVRVMDKGTHEMRPLQWNDIVILLRSMTGSAVWSEVFAREGIPCQVSTGTGYFSSVEIRTMLNYLKVLDNPRQDIPLAAALRSPIGHLRDEELSRIRIEGEGRAFLDDCQTYRETHDDQTADKLKRFFDMTDYLREEASAEPIHRLLWKICDLTGYPDYVTALPGGSVRRANLEMLIEKARAYESGTYKGLFNFVRYIENLKKYSIDYGEADAAASDAVRIMTIHKSKGLEFPVVFVSGLGRMFNRREERSPIVMHSQLGIGCDLVDYKRRIKVPLLSRNAIAQRIADETMGEEMRVLYVAMTRAREVLYLTGTVKDLVKSKERWLDAGGEKGNLIPELSVTKASCYLDWIMEALAADLNITNTEELFSISEVRSAASGRMNVSSRQSETAGRIALLQAYLLAKEETSETETAGRPKYRWRTDIPGKVSVSELKEQGFTQEEVRSGEKLFADMEERENVPAFRRTEQIGGAARGTLYHNTMQWIDLNKDSGIDSVRSQLESMVKCGKILGDDLKYIETGKISTFLNTSLGRRMAAAEKEGLLRREKPFVISLPARAVKAEYDSDEPVLVQGIIDAWFEEDGEIVLMDYKTDRVEDENTLAERYRIQLNYYAKALEMLTRMRVKERIIYSFHLGKEIPV